MTSRRLSSRWQRVLAVGLALTTALAALAVATRLRLDPNVAALLPERGEAAALRTYLRAFGGSDVAMVLIESDGASARPAPNGDDGASARPAPNGDDSASARPAPNGDDGASARPAPNGDDGAARSEAIADVAVAASEVAERLRELPEVEAAATSLAGGGEAWPDPWLAWRHADKAARARLAEALSAEGMRGRLRQTRALLLAPGGGSLADAIGSDPLRLSELVREERGVGLGFRVEADGSLVSEDGLARLVLVFPRGQALRGADARAFVSRAEAVLDEARRTHAALTIALTGGHAIAAATEAMLIRDLTRSGALSLVLASLAFLAVFRRARALIAVMPPLVVGTVWTAALAAALPQGLSAIAVAFMSVVIGVGVDTGVHVYAALLDARRDGLAPSDAAARARERTFVPVLTAAATAAAAFASLALSELGAMRQLGLLCACGELATALAIVALTPTIGAWLERTPAAPTPPSRMFDFIARATSHRTVAAITLVLAAAVPVAVGAGLTPRGAKALVALRPSGLAPLEVQERIYERFGGRRGQWVVLLEGDDREALMARADALSDRLGAMPAAESVDALTALVPAESTQRARLRERDALDLAAKTGELRRALADVGFAPGRFEPVLDGMRDASTKLVTLEELRSSGARVMLRRYLGGTDEAPILTLYVLPREGQSAAVEVEAAIRDTDPRASITGYERLEGSLRATMEHDLPRIGAVAALLVLLALAASLRSARDVAIAAGVVTIELGLVLLLLAVFDVPLHAYDALVLPVLLGITVDEAMFLLFRARQATGPNAIRDLLRAEGPLVMTTALTTAAGFAGLIACDFDGLRHVGIVGALGSVAGLVVACFVVPAALTLVRR